MLTWYQAMVMFIVASHTLVLILQLPTGGNEKSYSTQSLSLTILDIVFTSLYT
jgi:hypothetical protein